MMSISEHHINCFCGQPVDRIETSVSTNCPRCGANSSWPGRRMDHWPARCGTPLGRDHGTQVPSHQ